MRRIVKTKTRTSKRSSMVVGLTALFLVGHAGATSVFAAEQLYNLKINNTDLSAAVLELSAQTKTQILFKDSDLQKVSVTPLSGQYTPRQALRILVQGTNLNVTEGPNNTLTVQRPAAPEAANVRPGDIIVTATRREENLQDIPVSVTAFTAEDLQNNRATTVTDVARLAPGITASTFSNSNPIYAIRGATNTFSQAGASKPVGVFIDDVFVPRYSAADFELFDLERIEILRGPQGTLFGRNVTGGAILINTSRPVIGQNETVVQTGIGNYNYREVNGMTNLSVSNDTAFKLAASYKDREGYITDRFTGQDLNDLGSGSVRGQALHKFNNDFEVIVSGDYTKDENNGRGYTYLSNLAETNFTGNDGKIRTSELGVPQKFDRTIAGGSVRAFWNVGTGDFTSITAYRTSDSTEEYSFGAGSARFTSVANQQLNKEIDKPESFSQELRYASKKGKDFDYVAGFYYYNENTDRNVDITTLGAGGLTTTVRRNFDTNASTESLAGFGSATVHIAPRWDLTLGGRYTEETKGVSVNFKDFRTPAQNYSASPEATFDNFSTRVALNYFATDNVNLFVSRSEGFTAGGFNTEIAASNAALSKTATERAFKPETLTSYEVGAKTEWLDKSVKINVTAFYQEYENKQEGFLNRTPGFNYFSIFNAAQATMKGVELETLFNPVQGLTLGFNYTYLDATYDEFIIPGATPAQNVDFSGNWLQTSPRHKFAAILNYRMPFYDYGSLLFNANYAWQSDYFTGASNEKNFLIDGYGLLNSSISFLTPDEKHRVSVWGRNLLDTEYVLIRSTSGGIGEYYGAPRTYGVSATVKF